MKEKIEGIKAIIKGALMSYKTRLNEKGDISSFIQILKWIQEELNDLENDLESEKE